MTQYVHNPDMPQLPDLDNIEPPKTLAGGEDGDGPIPGNDLIPGVDPITTHALGEEGGDDLPIPDPITTYALGEEGGDDLPIDDITMTVGEAPDIDVPDIQLPNDDSTDSSNDVDGFVL
jgi:hypothetical protein